MDIVTWLIVGLLAGLLASIAVGGTGFGLGGVVFVAFIGAAVLLLVLRVLRRSTKTDVRNVVVSTGAAAFLGFAGLAGLGCATSDQDQQKALVHQQKSDEAARRGAFGVAADEQRKAADSHHDAVKRAIDEGKDIPPQTKIGDLPAADASASPPAK
jgi:uncharacterized membrane protein YeaQ/YmgE (transglycosylase-associated protein family)